MEIVIEPAKRAAALNLLRRRPFHGLDNIKCDAILGLAPQALCLRLLRRLKEIPETRALRAAHRYRLVGDPAASLINARASRKTKPPDAADAAKEI